MSGDSSVLSPGPTDATVLCGTVLTWLLLYVITVTTVCVACWLGQKIYKRFRKRKDSEADEE